MVTPDDLRFKLWLADQSNVTRLNFANTIGLSRSIWSFPRISISLRFTLAMYEMESASKLQLMADAKTHASLI